MALLSSGGVVFPGPVIATFQAPPEQTRFADDAFLDPVARELFTLAFDGWSEFGESIERYTARIDQRMAVGLRTPGRDRVIYHNETAVRAFWERNRLPIVQLLGARSQYPGRGIFLRETHLGWLEELPFDGPFAPGRDPFFVGSGEGAGYFIPADDDYLAHPLGQGADTLYRFRSRDTTTISFPGGSRLAAVRLDVIPRASDPYRISGALWIDPASGALVRGVYRVSRRLDMAREFPEDIGETIQYRLVPGFLKPLTVDVQLVAVDYSLLDFDMWLPRTVRFEGQVAAGVLKIPISIDYAYRIESVTRKDETAAAGGVDRHGGEALEEARFETEADEVAFIAQQLSEEGEVSYRPISDEEIRSRAAGHSIALDSRRSTPACWRTVPTCLRRSGRESARIPVGWRSGRVHPAHGGYTRGPGAGGSSLDFNLGWGRPDLLRYNRVEGLAVGGRFEWAMHGSYRLGTAVFFRIRGPEAQGTAGCGTLDRAPPPQARRLP